MKRMTKVGVFTLFLCVSLLCVTGCSRKRGELRRIWYSGSYNRDFNDLNDLHIASAKKLGITPVADREEAKHATRKMNEIKTNKYYEVEKLTHSIPYLVPEADKLLKDIGKNFQDSLRSHHAPLYKIKVTSVTRTTDDIKGLRKGNVNSTENSAHLYGTTFDISWVRYTKVDVRDTPDIDSDRLKMVLAMVLRDLQKEKRCYVKHERKQGCFHITVRKE
ncbi:MAG: DUF5715 family protein [Tannerellaceae bacterium]|nr:DUF5715 family protein [Tannerellaceae bacterium]